MEQTQLHVVPSGDLDQALLTSIQRPVRCQVATVLVAVGVPEHHLLQAATMIEPFAVSRVRPQRVDDVGGRLQVGDGLEQGHDADGQLRRRDRRCRRTKQADLAEQHGHFEHVGHRFALGDDVVLDGFGSEGLQHVGRRAQHGQLALGQFADRGVDTEQWASVTPALPTEPRHVRPRRERGSCRTPRRSAATHRPPVRGPPSSAADRPWPGGSRTSRPRRAAPLSRPLATAWAPCRCSAASITSRSASNSDGES